MGIEKTIIEQTLHGYSNGHRLLSFSKKFSDNEIKKMTILSDLSGNEFVNGFEKYYTGYRLNSDTIVLACTWYATEMKRPGCVWTHSLIFSENDLRKYGGEMGAVFSLFRKPKNNNDFSYYNKSLEIDSESKFDFDKQKLKYLIWCLWGNRSSRRSDRYREKERGGRCGRERRSEKTPRGGNGGCSDVLQRRHALLWNYGGGIKGGVYGEI